MPLPKVKPNEDQKTFISRCAGDPVMNKDFPKTPQRVGVCYSIWQQSKKKKSKGSERTWAEIRAEYVAKFGENHHCLRLICDQCNKEMNCRCTQPKTTEHGLCEDCASKRNPFEDMLIVTDV